MADLRPFQIQDLEYTLADQPDYQELLRAANPLSNDQVALVGAFAVLVQAYGTSTLPQQPRFGPLYQVPPRPAIPRATETIPFDALRPILGSPLNAGGLHSLSFPSYTIVSSSHFANDSKTVD